MPTEQLAGDKLRGDKRLKEKSTSTRGRCGWRKQKQQTGRRLRDEGDEGREEDEEGEDDEDNHEEGMDASGSTWRMRFPVNIKRTCPRPRTH